MNIYILAIWDDSTFHNHPKAAQEAEQNATKSSMAHMLAATPWQKNVLIGNKFKSISNLTST